MSLQMKSLARGRPWLLILGAALVAYLLLAYLILPAVWTHHEREPGLASLPMVTRTGDGIPGDALNVGLVGNKEDITRAMHAAEWFPADPITLRTSIEIIGSVMLDRPYHDAPVSPLYYQGKRSSLPSKNLTARAPIGGITFGCGRSLKKGRMVVRSGSARSHSIGGSA